MANPQLLNAVTLVLVIVSMIAAIASVVLAITNHSKRKAARAAHFAREYGSSVERMLSECPVDKAHLRSIRDAGRGGVPAAVRELLRSEPMPLEPAAEFIRRL